MLFVFAKLAGHSYSATSDMTRTTLRIGHPFPCQGPMSGPDPPLPQAQSHCEPFIYMYMMFE